MGVIPTPFPSSSPSDFTMPLQDMRRSGIKMELGYTNIMDENGITKWEQTTAEAIEREVRKVLGDKIITLKVIVTLQNQYMDPLYQTQVTMAPSQSPPKRRKNQEQDFWDRGRKLQEGGNIRRNLKKLYLLFDVEILIRSLKKTDEIDRFVGGAFNDINDQQAYVLALRESGSDVFENTLTVGVALTFIDGADKIPKGPEL